MFGYFFKTNKPLVDIKKKNIQEFHSCTNEIKRLEELKKHVDNDIAEALENGIQMYKVLRSSIVKDLKEQDGKKFSQLKIVYSTNKIYMIRDGKETIINLAI